MNNYDVAISSDYLAALFGERAESAKRIADLERELAEARQRAASLRSKLETVRKDADDLRVELLMSNMTTAALVECCASLENKIASAAQALK